VRSSYTHTASHSATGNTTVRVAPVQVTYLDCAIQYSSVLITVVSVRVRSSYTHSANTTVRVAPVQVLCAVGVCGPTLCLLVEATFDGM
jgi:hypothetical protein